MPRKKIDNYVDNEQEVVTLDKPQPQFDYSNKDELMKTLRARVRGNLLVKSEPILASGMAEFDPETDTLVSDIFDRADKDMYINKRELKKEEKQIAKKQQ